MDFKTKFATYGHERVYSDPGSPIKAVYTSRYDDNGDIIVEKTGETDFQAFIDSHADSCDLKKMIARFELGDPDALNKVPGVYMDTTGFPTSYVDLFNRVQEANETFDGLPVDVKELFDNNPVKFFTEYGSKDFIEKISKLDRYKVPNMGQNKVEEVKADVNAGTNE